MDAPTPIDSIPSLIQTTLADAEDWKPVFPWFRGERDLHYSSLLPRVFRKKYDENNLLQSFRRRAHLLNLPVIPPVGATDQWLFLARHVGLPTRLLDWTEGALVALYFALTEVETFEAERSRFGGPASAKAILWTLNPMRLNRLSLLVAKEDGAAVEESELEEPQGNFFPLTWYDPTNRINIGSQHINRAWEGNRRTFPVPVAVEPTNIHPRMNAQHSYFTVHGDDERPLDQILADAVPRLQELDRSPYKVTDLLRKYTVEIPPEHGLAQLRTLGISDSTVMPDADSLAKELGRFMSEG